MSYSNAGAAIERFSIIGLHGYKNISIDFAGKATIIVAENGTGKTTFMNTLNAFLTLRFHRLKSIAFESIECTFAGQSPIRLDRIDLGDATEIEGSESVKRLAAYAAVPENVVIDFIQNEYRPQSMDSLRNHWLVSKMYTGSPHGFVHLDAELMEVQNKLSGSLSDVAKQVVTEVRRCMGETEVLYFPTYRRIERPMLRKTRAGRTTRSAVWAITSGVQERSQRGGNEWVRSEHDDMAFGLGDVEQRLRDMSEEVERTSNLAYRSLSAKMLEELLAGSADRDFTSKEELPDIESLDRFLRRVSHSGSGPKQLIESITAMYLSASIMSDDNKTVRYFLSRLGTVIDRTRESEAHIEQFVNVCNAYLMMSSDEKRLVFNPQTLRVTVYDLFSQKVIPLDDLSSGEKQIVSLMAKLYLSEGPKLVLIDEPELSLSLDWQRKVLPDVVNSPTVVQLLAITHSPFVFENELDNAARIMHITRSDIENV